MYGLLYGDSSTALSIIAEIILILSGAVFEEEGEGNVLIIASKAFTSNNDDSDNTGMELVQEDEGVGTAHVFNSTVIDGFDLEGVNQIN